MRGDPGCSSAKCSARSPSRCRTARRRRLDFALTRPASHPDEVEVLYGYESREVGLEAGDVARDIIMELIAPREHADDALDVGEEIAAFMKFASRRALGPSALALVQAAEARDIPWARMNEASMIQVGQGKYQKRIEAALSSQTSHIAVEIASDKESARACSSDLGLPVPKQGFVRDAEEAVEAAEAHRLPGGGQTGGRQPRPRRRGQPHLRGGGRGRLRGRPRRRLRRGGREHDPGRRPPAVRGERRTGRRRAPHARPRGRRRRP